MDDAEDDRNDHTENDTANDGIDDLSCDAHLFWRHAEVDHGLPFVSRLAARMCTAHKQWNFGLEQLEEHHAGHIDAAADERENRWVSTMCMACLRDTSLPLAVRAHTHRAGDLTRHVLRVHLLRVRDWVTLCFVCDAPMETRALPKHLLDAHGLNLIVNRRLKSDGSDLSALRKVAATRGNWETDEFVAYFQQDRSTESADGLAEGSRTRVRANVASGFTTVNAESDAIKSCPFCLADDPQSEPRYFTHRQREATHLLAHFVARRDKSLECPECHQVVEISRLPSHLEDHGYNLSGKKNEKVGHDLNKIYDAEIRPRKQWLQWIAAGCPSNSKRFKPRKNNGPSKARKSGMTPRR